MALLVNPSNPVIAETDTIEARSAASNFGVELHVLSARFDTSSMHFFRDGSNW
jgi:hypothetical protein